MEATPVSEGVKRIVEHINANPRCSRRQLVETLAPSPPIAVSPPAEGQPAAEVSHQPTAEQTAVIADLHWLIHQGHVIEFANGTLETAKKPIPRPQKAVKAAEAPAAGVVGESMSAEGSAAPLEGAEAVAPENRDVPEPTETTEPETGKTEELAANEPAAPEGEATATPAEHKEAPVENAPAHVESPS